MTTHTIPMSDPTVVLRNLHDLLRVAQRQERTGVSFGEVGLASYYTAMIVDILTIWNRENPDKQMSVEMFADVSVKASLDHRECDECARVFDMSNDIDIAEWHHGHDCEA